MIAKMQPFVYPSYTAITHGDFNPHNILIDQNYCSWLLDFQSTRPSHILRDVAMLDAVIRFQLLYAHEATLEERLAMEEALCSVTHFSQLDSLEAHMPGDNPAIAKAFTTAVHLRLLARWIVEKNPMAEINEYYVALLYATLNTLRFASLESVQREHALLSASLLIDLLSLN